VADTPQRGRRSRFAAALAASLLLHAGLTLWLARRPRVALAPKPPRPLEVDIVAAPREPEVKPEPAPQPEPAGAPTRRRAPRGKVAQAPAGSPPTPEAGPTSPSSVEVEQPSLLRMRGGPNLMPDRDTLARALGPEEMPEPSPKPGKRPRKIPGTGITSYLPDQADNIKKGMAHPRAFDVLTGVERLFKVDPKRVEDNLRGDLHVDKSIKRWLLGELAGDADAMRSQVPWLACLVCVTLRPSKAPEVEIVGTSGSEWFDRAARESVETASTRAMHDDDFPASRACFHFAARLYRQRPDITNLLNVPFMLKLETRLRLLTFDKIGG
jgi:hypothetical protein